MSGGDHCSTQAFTLGHGQGCCMEWLLWMSKAVKEGYIHCPHMGWHLTWSRMEAPSWLLQHTILACPHSSRPPHHPQHQSLSQGLVPDCDGVHTPGHLAPPQWHGLARRLRATCGHRWITTARHTTGKQPIHEPWHLGLPAMCVSHPMALPCSSPPLPHGQGRQVGRKGLAPPSCQASRCPCHQPAPWMQQWLVYWALALPGALRVLWLPPRQRKGRG